MCFEIVVSYTFTYFTLKTYKQLFTSKLILSKFISKWLYSDNKINDKIDIIPKPKMLFIMQPTNIDCLFSMQACQPSMNKKWTVPSWLHRTAKQTLLQNTSTVIGLYYFLKLLFILVSHRIEGWRKVFFF